MRTSDLDILMIPGLGNSGPDHWQSRWEAKLSTARRVEQADWERPMREPWVSAIMAAVRASARPTLLVAHSLGVLAVAQAAAALDGEGVAGAFLVAPPDPASDAFPSSIDPAFRRAPTAPLPFPSLLVASRNDPYAGYDASAGLAAAWGATLVDAGEAGHINTGSGHGPWPEGLLRFAGFLKGL